MIGEILKIQPTTSRYGGHTVYLLAIKAEGNSYKCWVDPKNRNWIRWEGIIKAGVGAKLGNLAVKGGNGRLIDADSEVILIEE